MPEIPILNQVSDYALDERKLKFFQPFLYYNLINLPLNLTFNSIHILKKINVNLLN